MLGSSLEKKAFHIKIQTELFIVSEPQLPSLVQTCHHASQPNTKVILRQCIRVTVEQPRPRKHFLGKWDVISRKIQSNDSFTLHKLQLILLVALSLYKIS